MGSLGCEIKIKDCDFFCIFNKFEINFYLFYTSKRFYVNSASAACLECLEQSKNNETPSKSWYFKINLKYIWIIGCLVPWIIPNLFVRSLPKAFFAFSNEVIFLDFCLCVQLNEPRVFRVQLFPLSFDLGARWLDCPRQVAQLSIKIIEIRGMRDSQAVHNHHKKDPSGSKRANKSDNSNRKQLAGVTLCRIISMS